MKYSIPFFITVTNHLLVKINIENQSFCFLVDTGASASCIDQNVLQQLAIETTPIAFQIASANAHFTDSCKTQPINISLGQYQTKREFVSMDMQFINQALAQQSVEPVFGIMGADWLISENAVIDFVTKQLTFR